MSNAQLKGKLQVINYKGKKMAERLYWHNESTIRALERSLQGGNVILGDSDTVLGLLASCTQQGFDKLNELKRRTDKPYLILIGSIDKVDHFADRVHAAPLEKLMQACWPGPLTLIVPARADCPAYLKSDDNTVALRVPHHEGLLRLLTKVNGLFSTSANISGQPIPNDIDHVDPSLLHSVDAIVLNKNGTKKTVIPSTIIDATGDTLRVVREGAFSQDDISTILKAQ